MKQRLKTRTVGKFLLLLAPAFYLLLVKHTVAQDDQRIQRHNVKVQLHQFNEINTIMMNNRADASHSIKTKSLTETKTK